MTRPPFALFAVLLFGTARLTFAAPADQAQLDGNESLFTVLAAINACGYDADLNNPVNSPVRKAVRDHIIRQQLSSVDDLRKFFNAHRQKDNGAELSQYVSYALSVEGPPDFRYKFKPGEVPPDVIPLEGLSELLAAFYKDAHIAELWAKSQPAYEQVIAAYHPLVMTGVQEVNAYLRNPTSGYLGRRFQVFVDLLGAPNQIHTRSYKDDYTIVLTPSAEPQAEEVRHGYLHYLLDPLVLKNAEPLDKKRSLFDFAQGAPALDQSYKDDYFLLVGECLIKGVESRLARGAARKQAAVDQAAREGFIYTPAFADALGQYEKQEQAFRLYFRDMIELIDPKAETRRLDKVEFVRERAGKPVKAVPPPAPVEPVGVFKTLAKAEAAYAERKLEAAREAYLECLKAPDEQALHAKAYYGLARIAALQKDPELSEKLFEKTLELSPDDETRGWSLVYLARLAEAHGERERAIEHYKAALGVAGATAGAKKAAEQGIRQSFANQK